MSARNRRPANPDLVKPATATANADDPTPFTKVWPQMKEPPTGQSDTPRFTELYAPKLLTVLREGYGLPQLRADAIAGVTVAIVALPLSMAIAIASGVTPAQGLYTAVVGGFLVSLLGGSRFQIGGPAGAFIVLIAATVAQHGIDGLLLATFLSGLMLAAAGMLNSAPSSSSFPSR